MELRGYRLQNEPRVVSLYDADEILDYVEEMRLEEAVVLERTGEDTVKVYHFIMEDGEQLPLNIKDKD